MKPMRAPVIPLRYSADWRSLGFLAALSLLFAAQWCGWFRHWALVPLTGLFAFIACIIKHNHVHCRTFTDPGWNMALAHWLGLCTGQPTSSIIAVHNERHHAQHQTEADCVRSSLARFRWNWLNYLVFPWLAVREVRRVKRRDSQRWRRDRPTLHRRARVERLVVTAFVIALLVMDGRATLIYVVVPWLMGHWGIVVINLLQHQDCDHMSPHDHSRNITGQWANWWFLNNGFHTAHHLSPPLHWSLLPEFHRIYVAPHARSDLNHPSLWHALWRQLSTPRSGTLSRSQGKRLSNRQKNRHALSQSSL